MKNSLIKQGRLDFSVGPKQQTVWGFREALVFFLEGLGVTLFVAFMKLKYVPAMVVGIALLVAAVMLLLSHLGHPFRAWMAIRSVRRSWISRGTVVISGFVGLGAAYVAMALVPGIEMAGWWDGPFRLVLILTGLFILLYPGFAMAASSGIPFWNSGLLPVLSMVNGIASGGIIVLTFVVAVDTAPSTTLLPGLIWFEQSVLCFIAICIFSYMDAMRSAGAAASFSATYLMTREVVLFWGMAIVIGLAVPIAIVALVASFAMAPLSLLWVAVLARLIGDVSLRYAFLRAGVYEAVL
jgi:formate-dependent nitrite reductase membrane component NrfD